MESHIYKPSGVDWIGQIPAHWDVTRTKFVARMESGHTPSRSKDEYWGGEIPWFSLSDISKVREDGQKYINETEEQITQAGLDNSGARVLPEDTVILSRTASVGFTCILGRPSATDQSMVNWVCGPEILPEYLYYVFKAMSEEFDKLARGSTHETIYMPDMNQIRTPLPPISEQKDIVSGLNRTLSNINNIIERKHELIAHLERRQSAFIDNIIENGLGDNPLTNPDVGGLDAIPNHWDIIKISHASDWLRNGHVGSTQDILREDGIRYIQSLHVKDNQINHEPPYYVDSGWAESSDKSELKTDDVVVVQTGDIGQVAVVPEEFDGAHCHALIIITPKAGHLSGEYLSWVLNSTYGQDKLKERETGALHPHLNCGEVKQIPIPLPPIEEQRQINQRITSWVQQVREAKNDLSESISLMEERQLATTKSAVTGQINVTEERGEEQDSLA